MTHESRLARLAGREIHNYCVVSGEGQRSEPGNWDRRVTGTLCLSYILEAKRKSIVSISDI